jgi:hypothetical protein
MRFFTGWGVVAQVAMVALASGCATHATEQTLSEGDLRRIATVRPMTPGWSWPEEPTLPDAPQSDVPSPAEETPSPTDTDPLAKALDRQIVDAGGVVAADGSRWQDEQKLGVTLAMLFKSDAGARTVLAAQRAFQRGWVERTLGGGHFTDLPVEGLGEEAWRIQSDFPGGQEVTLGWRRASLTLQVHIQCIFQTCSSDISLAARAWVDAIDKEAVSALDGHARASPGPTDELSVRGRSLRY